MNGWKRIIARCAVQLAAMSVVACGAGVETDPSQSLTPSADKAGGRTGILVSPELFELASSWSAEPSGPKGLHAASTASASTGPDFVSYTRLHAPELVQQAEEAFAQMGSGSPQEPSALNEQCQCQVWGTFHISKDSQSGSGQGGSWDLSCAGPAHTGRIYQSGSGHKFENVSNSARYATQFRTRLICRTPYNTNCVAGCSAKMYADVQYSTQVLTKADTGGIWSKGSTAQIVDGVTLELLNPYASSTRLFEKAVSLSHYATNTTLNLDELAELVKNGLQIYTGITKGEVGGDLISRTVKSLFGLIHRGGADGSTAQGLHVGFESPFWEPIQLNYSSVNNQYYGLNLASEVRMKVRGWGGWHRAEGTVASSYSMAIYMDNFVCDANVAQPPQRTAFWRYDAYDGAPQPTGVLQQRVGNFLQGAFGVPADVSRNEGTVSEGVCGDRICGGLESDATCAVDCVVCGDNKCSSTENTSTCPGDCLRCGDKVCSRPSETVYSCPGDCGSCGDGICSPSESAYSCRLDCGADTAHCGSTRQSSGPSAARELCPERPVD
jgi:hypothetical protein